MYDECIEKAPDGMIASKWYQLASKWYQLAANQGHANAQVNLRIMHKNGIGVVKNDPKAINWDDPAAKQKLDNAYRNVKNLCDEYRKRDQNHAVSD
jgi:TPR repeat protein